MNISCNASHFPLTCASVDLTSEQVGTIYSNLPEYFCSMGDALKNCLQIVFNKYNPSNSSGFQQRLDLTECIIEKCNPPAAGNAINILFYIDQFPSFINDLETKNPEIKDFALAEVATRLAIDPLKFNLAHKYLSQIKYTAFKDLTCSNIALRQAFENPRSNYVKVLETISDISLKDETYRKLTHKFIENKDFMSALFCSHQIDDQTKRNSAFHELALAYFENGYISKVSDLANKISDLELREPLLKLANESESQQLNMDQ